MGKTPGYPVTVVGCDGNRVRKFPYTGVLFSHTLMYVVGMVNDLIVD